MTFAGALGASLVRSAAVAMGGVWLAGTLSTWLDSLSGRMRAWAWIAVLAPAFTPALLTGYCYRDTALSLAGHPAASEALYAFLLAAQSVPAAVILLRFAPPAPVSASAVHCQRLLRARGVAQWRLWLQARSRSLLPAAALLCLLTFQEAELASLLQARSWTEWLFTRHAGGWPLADSLRWAAIPALLQLPLLLPVLWWLGAEEPAEDLPPPRRLAPGLAAISSIWTMAALAVACLLPAWQLWRGARQGWPALLQQPSTWRELFDAALLAVTSGGLALFAARCFQGRRSWLSGAVLLPGLCGNLTLALLLAAIFQTSPLLGAYDTPLPLVLGETLFLLPRAVLLWCCLMRLSRWTGPHCLSLFALAPDAAQARRVGSVWRRSVLAPWLGAAALCCFWAYLEVMLPALLAPPGMAPVGLVLYNSLHYGRISALGAKLALALAIPAGLGACIPLLRRVRLSLRRS